jgi:plastocyanin
MGIAIPQVITSDRASGAQVIDGSLKFDSSSSQYLKRSLTADGNRRLWTWSGWLKRTPGSLQDVFSAGQESTNDGLYSRFRIDSTDYLNFRQWTDGPTFDAQVTSNMVLRDPSAFFHYVIIYDTAQSTDADKVRQYINGQQVTSFSSGDYPALNAPSHINRSTKTHTIGGHYDGGGTNADSFWNGHMSQVYFIDGQALGPDYFGFTDPLTNTWKPKKFIPQATPNNGTTWSSGAGSNFESARPASNGFNGDPETFTRTDNASVTATVTLPSSVPFTTLQVRGARDSGNGTITINGTDVSSQFTSSSSTLETVTITGVTSPLTSIALTGISGSAQPRFSQIIVDGVTLIDGDTSNMGLNGFYLPFDGSAPIGQDQSGNGNDWTPVNFGGFLELDNPNVSGARPILNTTQGGSQATVGVFGSKQNVGYAVTYYDDGGGNKYYIDGVKQATLTGLIRGATYTFDTVALGSTHPFRFAASDGGSQYSNGVAAITGTATTITIPYNAPNELYYYCTSHSGMGSSITGITTNEKLADQYASNCTLAAPLVGSTNDTCASIACTSRNKTATSSGPVGVSTESNFYSGSYYYGAASNTLQYAEQGDELVFGTSDFTIECWVYDDNGHNGGGSGRCYIFDNRIGGSVTGDPPTMAGYVDSHNEFNFYDGDGDITHTVVTTVGKWWHYAVTREGTTTRMFIDGVLRGSSTSSTNFTNNGIGVGRATDGGYGWAGYIQDFRVYKGIAKYTSDFVVPSRSPDILPDTPSGVASGSKLAKITDGAVAFDGTGDDLHIADSADFEFGTGDFTIECFAYHTVDSDDHLISKYGSSNANRSWRLVSDGNQKIIFYWYYSTDSSLNITSAAGKFSLNRWHHIVAQRTSGDIYLFVDGELVGSNTSSGAAAEFNDNSTAVAIAGDLNGSSQDFPGFISNVRIVKGTGVYSTLGFAPPAAPLTNVTNTKLLCCQSVAEQQNNFIRYFLSDTLYTTKADILANATEVGDGESGISNKYWYIIPTGDEPIGSDVFTNDGSVTTPQASNNFALYWRNGSSWTQTIGTYGPSEYSDFDYKSDDSSSTYSVYPARDFYVFGADDGSPAPKLISGTLPTRAKYYKFDGAVKPGTITANGDAAATNFNPFNTDINTVRGQETGYATLNPLDSGHSGASITFSDGNLNAAFPSTSGTGQAPASIYVSSGKWYCEYYLESVSDLTSVQYGIVSPGSKRASYIGKADTTDQYGWEPEIDRAYNNGTNTTPTGKTFTSQWNVAAMALDLDNGTWEMFIDGVATGTIYSNISGTYTFAIGDTMNAGYHTHTANFGQKPFKFSPPDGFQPLNTANTRPETVITRPDQYVGISTWTGDGNTGRNIKTLLFKPDLVWIKQSDAVRAHALFDTVRGANKRLQSSSTNTETTHTDQMSAFIDNGFTVEDNNTVNVSNGTYVGWSWRAGGNKNTFNVDDVGYATAAAAGLDGGSGTVTGASVGTKQGFSIISYTGNSANPTTFSHGLLEAPRFVIIKNRDRSTNGDWIVGHAAADGDGFASGNQLILNSNAAVDGGSSNYFSGTAPTSSVFTVKDNYQVNYSGDDYIAYLWHDVPGLQKFGQFAGNNNADGVFVELGFKPAILLIKNDNSTGDWIIWDNERNPHNPVNRQIWPYTSSGTYGAYDQVASNYPLDFLSNGFKMRTTDADMNGSSRTYIYAAWAEAPSVDLFGGGANAR